MDRGETALNCKELTGSPVTWIDHGKPVWKADGNLWAPVQEPAIQEGDQRIEMATFLSDRRLRTGWHAGDNEPIPVVSAVAIEDALAIELNEALEAIAKRECATLARGARRD
jgi:hypothetical protein